MKTRTELLAITLSLSLLLTLGPEPGAAIAAVEAESTSDPAASGKPASGAGVMATGLEAFKTDLATGAASFSFSIETPPGTGGMQPEIALSYSSSAGNGWAGFGWTVDLGRIARRTERGAPSYDDAADTFGLDGARLVAGTGGEYHTEIESFLRIRHLAAGTIADHWEVASKDGRKLRFGATANSRIADPADPSRIFAWLLDRVEDAFGNFMTVSYQDGGDAPNRYPAAVNYTFHAGPPESGGLVGGVGRRVEFCLEGSDDACEPAAPALRADPVSSYVSGFRVQTSRRLTSIRTFVDGQPVRRYDLAYLNPGEPAGASSATSRLVSLQVAGSAGTKLPAMTFGYSPGAAGYALEAGWANPSGANDQFGKKYEEIRKQRASGAGLAGVIDLDGDGVPDRVTNGDALFWNFHRALPEGGYGARDLWEYGSGDQTSSFETREITDLDGAHVQADVIDLDGDGLPDRLAERKDAAGLWDVYWNDGSAFTEQPGGGPFIWANPSGSMDEIYDSLRRYDGQGGNNLIAEIIDLNGDGFPDRLLGGKNSFPDPWKVYLSDGRNGFSAGPIDWANPSGSEGDGSNGDIQRRNNTGVLADLVDLNGDGLPDRVVKDARTAWKVWFNTGKGFESVAR
ncbi:MAG: SpvB/TcaC N-terminal domain-containing protein, partial [Deltaproteobacteria bacterium]|nr:SpvB/TcaC N-terminal domain-containing protein [Deltaproteobacteria bacterium]